MINVSTNQIVGRTLDLLRTNFLVATLLIVGLSALATSADAFFERVTFLDSIAALVAQYHVTKRLLANEGHGNLSGGFGAVFAVCLLSNIGILLGLVLLVLPGLVLAVRWFIAVPIVIAEDDGAKAALKRSWAITKEFWPSVAAALLILCAPFLLVFVGLIFSGADDAGFVDVWDVAGNFCLYLGMVCGWHCAVAVCGICSSPSDRLEQVFA